MLLPSIQYPCLDICVSHEQRAHLACRITVLCLIAAVAEGPLSLARRFYKVHVDTWYRYQRSTGRSGNEKHRFLVWTRQLCVQVAEQNGDCTVSVCLVTRFKVTGSYIYRVISQRLCVLHAKSVAMFNLSRTQQAAIASVLFGFSPCEIQTCGGHSGLAALDAATILGAKQVRGIHNNNWLVHFMLYIMIRHISRYVHRH